MPLDFMQEHVVIRESSFGIEEQAGFDRAMAGAARTCTASWKGAAKQTANPAYQQLPKSTFEGYRQTRSENCEVLAIIKAAKARKNSIPAKKAKSFSTTRRSMPNPAARSAIADGSTPTITTQSSPK